MLPGHKRKTGQACIVTWYLIGEGELGSRETERDCSCPRPGIFSDREIGKDSAMLFSH